MDTEKARVFIKILETGSFSEAATLLGYTVSGISRSVAALENEAGFALFSRSRKGVKPTRDAEGLIPALRDLACADQVFRSRCADVRGLACGSVTIGIAYSAYFRSVAGLIARFTQEHPGVAVSTLQGTSSELAQALAEHRADVVIGTRREEISGFHLLIRDPMWACLPKDHPASGQGSVPLSIFGSGNVVAPYPGRDTDYARAFREYGIVPQIRYSATDIHAARCLIAAGLGIGLFNRLEAAEWKDDVVLLPTRPEVVLPIGIMYPDKAEMTVAGRAFLKLLTEGLDSGTK